MSSDNEEDSVWIRRGLNSGPGGTGSFPVPPASSPQAPPPQYGQAPAPADGAPASLGPRRLAAVVAVLVLIAVVVALVLILV